jgi:predicted enzyme related to lactoylglutathione lyase
MHPTGITANLSVADLAEARNFYADFLGLSVEGFNLGWVVNLQSPDGRAVVQLVTQDATSPVDSVISVHVGDEVEAAYEEAQRRGFEIVHPLTTEPWGCADPLSVRQTATSSTLSTTKTKTANSRKAHPQRSSAPGAQTKDTLGQSQVAPCLVWLHGAMPVSGDSITPATVA